MGWAMETSAETNLLFTTTGRCRSSGREETEAVLAGCAARCWPSTGAGPLPAVGAWRTVAELTGGELAAPGGRRAPAARPGARRRQPRHPRLRRAASVPRAPGRGVARPADLDPAAEPAQAGALRLLADRPRPRAPGPGHRRRAAHAQARPTRWTGWPSTRSPSCWPGAGELIHPASAFLASESGHFESEAAEHDLHAFQAVRTMDEILVSNFMVFTELTENEHLRPVGRRRGLGHRLLPAREPRAQAGALRLDDRLRGLAADAGRRRAGAGPDRRLQRRDDRADRALPRAAGPRRIRRQPGRRRPATGSATACPPSATGSSGTTSSPATSPASTRPPSPTATRSAPSSATGPMSRSAWSPSAAPAWAPTCCAG